MSEPVVRWDVDGGIATMTIAREKALNALNKDVMDSIDRLIAEAVASGDVTGILITGAGEKAFVAGADIGELSAISDARAGRAAIARGQGILNRIERCPIPVLACINGFALGGGLELALACHMRYAVKDAQLGLPEVKLGLIPGYGGTQRLARLVGRGRATEMILSAEFCDGEAAERMGLVNRVFDDSAAMLEAGRKLLGNIAKRGPLAVRAALEAIDRGLGLELGQGLALEADLFGLLCGSDDMREGLAAFLEKRKADFKGR